MTYKQRLDRALRWGFTILFWCWCVMWRYAIDKGGTTVATVMALGCLVGAGYFYREETRHD